MNGWVIGFCLALVLAAVAPALAESPNGPGPEGWVKQVTIYDKTPDGSKVDGTFTNHTKEINKTYNGSIKRNQGGDYIVCANSAHYEFNHTLEVTTKFGKAVKTFRTFQGHCDNDMALTVKY